MLGRGNFAVVYAGLERATGRGVAIKTIKKSRIKALAPGKVLMIYSEVAILRRLDHPNIVKVLDVYDTEPELLILGSTTRKQAHVVAALQSQPPQEQGHTNTKSSSLRVDDLSAFTFQEDDE